MFATQFLLDRNYKLFDTNELLNFRTPNEIIYYIQANQKMKIPCIWM